MTCPAGEMGWDVEKEKQARRTFFPHGAMLTLCLHLLQRGFDYFFSLSSKNTIRTVISRYFDNKSV